MPFRRRTFLAGASVLPALPPHRAHAALVALPRFEARDDGTFNIVHGDLALLDCFPAFDDAALHPIAVKVDRAPRRTTIHYQLSQGSVLLTLSSDDDSVVVESALEGLARAPHHFFPIAGARVVGANRFFKQGLGFGGPSGLFPFPTTSKWTSANHLSEDAWSFDSYLCTAVVSETGQTLATGAYHHRDFLQRTTLFNRTRRQLLVDKLSLTDDPILESGFATERIPLSERLSLPALHIVGASSPWDGLARLARNIGHASNARVSLPTRYNWDTWYEYADDYDSRRLDDALEGLKKVHGQCPLQSVVIDAGYCFLGDWTKAEAPDWPGGLPAAFERIKAAGFAPGAYVGPFMVSSHSDFYKAHPEAVLHDLDGKPLLHGSGKPVIDNRSLSENNYFLDSSHPAGFEHIKTTFRTFRAWGATLYKTDFWEWGFKDSTKIKRHTPGKTSVQYLTDVLDMVRAEIGPESHLIGCIAPLAPFIGHVDSMRLGYDTEPGGWRPEGNIVNMFNETFAGQYFNNVLWQNDPDVIYLRSSSNPLNDQEIEALALWAGILGGVMGTSDRLHHIAPERLALLRFVQPGPRKLTARLPFWYDGRQERIAVRRYDDRDAWAVLMVNATQAPIDVRCPLDRALGVHQAFCFRWNVGHAAPLGARASLDETLKPHEAKLFYVSRVNTPPPANLGLAGVAMA